MTGFRWHIQKVWAAILVFLLLGTLLYFSVQNRYNRLGADADFVPVFEDNGNFFVVSGGVGTRGNPATGDWTGSGDIVLEIPDTATIISARAIWTGRSGGFDANGVTLAVDGGVPTVLTADLQYEQSPWCCRSSQIHESDDVTALIQPGTHTYTIAGHEHGMLPTGDELNYGVGIWAVYENTPAGISGDLERETIIYQGQDSFFRNWGPARGPHTEVRCATFTPSPVERQVDMVHLVSGVDTWDTATNSTRLRSVAVWSETGVGPLPPEDERDFLGPDDTPTLALRPNSVGYVPEDDPNISYPLQSYAQLEWDNFDMTGLVVPADHEWLCFQIESGDHADLADEANVGLEASGMWNLFALSIFNPELAVNLVGFEATAVSNSSVRLTWQTESEINNFGFNIYRSTTDEFDTAEIIHFEPSNAANQSGKIYRVDDDGLAFGTYYYWLEDIDTSSGETAVRGPISVEVPRFNQQYLPLIPNP